MKIRMLKIKNFKAIRYAELNDLQDVVVVAGLNGCGKSCIFDAIRLIKSSCGGYTADNEYTQFFQEFLTRSDVEGIQKISHDKNHPIEIEWELELSRNEKNYISKHASELARKFVLEEHYRSTNSARNTVESQIVIHQKQNDINILQQQYSQQSQLEKLYDSVSYFVERGEAITTPPKLEILKMIFTIYMSDQIGVIDYHGPHRNYARENFNTVNLNIEVDSENKLKQSALYNYQNKYINIKQDLAATYIKELIASAAQKNTDERIAYRDLSNSLKTLFNIFIPGKEFKGIIPTSKGTLSFPVTIQDGKEHDLDDLSSGEKEVLYGYLRLVKETPKHSILLIDEPELHLNPRMIKELPIFYHEHIGTLLDNQIWLITHSDSLIRGSVNQNHFSVFHMATHTQVAANGNQISSISSADEVTSTIINLVGDAATYIPNGNIDNF